MCGICGIYNFDQSPVDKINLLKMNDAMALRGPDDSGFYINNNVGMAMRRLSIIDINSGHQPMLSHNGEISVVFNGEIYNFIELRQNLINLGYKFRTESDTEVIIAMYQEYKENFIEKLNGMFSICLFDKKDNTLLIIRDRIGIKPLFYILNDKKIFFASSINSLKKIENNLEINKNNFLLYLSLNYTPKSESIYNRVKKLKPGHYIKIKHNKVSFNQYWSLPNFKKTISENIYLDGLKDLIENSIKIQSRSDVPVGSMLSGGLDSSLISILFAKKISYPIKSFCIDFDDKEINENVDALKISKQIKSIHISERISRQHFFSSLNEVTTLMDEPISDNAIIPSYILSKLAKKNDIKVILSGAGGDEVFGGYERHYRSFKSLFHGLVNVDDSLSKKIIKILPTNLKNYFYKLSNSSFAHASKTSGVNISTVFDLLRGDGQFADELIFNLENIFNPFLKNQKLDYKERVMTADINNYLPDNVLSLLDKTTMMNSIEGRVPLLDHRIVDYVFSHNSKNFTEKNFNNSKGILKKIFIKDLPKFILKKKKIGFNAPLQNWHTDNYKYFINNFSSNSFYNSIFQKNFHKNKKLENKNNAGTIFALNVFDSWFKNNDE